MQMKSVINIDAMQMAGSLFVLLVFDLEVVKQELQMGGFRGGDGWTDQMIIISLFYHTCVSRYLRFLTSCQRCIRVKEKQETFCYSSRD